MYNIDKNILKKKGRKKNRKKTINKRYNKKKILGGVNGSTPGDEAAKASVAWEPEEKPPRLRGAHQHYDDKTVRPGEHPAAELSRGRPMPKPQSLRERKREREQDISATDYEEGTKCLLYNSGDTLLDFLLQPYCVPVFKYNATGNQIENFKKIFQSIKQNSDPSVNSELVNFFKNNTPCTIKGRLSGTPVAPNVKGGKFSWDSTWSVENDAPVELKSTDKGIIYYLISIDYGKGEKLFYVDDKYIEQKGTNKYALRTSEGIDIGGGIDGINETIKIVNSNNKLPYYDIDDKKSKKTLLKILNRKKNELKNGQVYDIRTENIVTLKLLTNNIKIPSIEYNDTPDATLKINIILSSCGQEIIRPLDQDIHRQMIILPSQLNGAEHPSESRNDIPNIYNDYWINTYFGDNTGGPRGQLAGSIDVAREIVRISENYYNKNNYNDKLNNNLPINYVRNVIKAVEGCGITLENGYLKVPNNISDDNTKKFIRNMDKLYCLASLDNPASGFNTTGRLDITQLNDKNTGKKIDMVYASGIPINSYTNDYNNKNLKIIAINIIYNQYSIALQQACYLAQTIPDGTKYQVLIMPLGVGVFKNNAGSMIYALQKAITSVKKLEGYKKLDIKLLLWSEGVNDKKNFLMDEKIYRVFSNKEEAEEAAQQDKVSISVRKRMGATAEAAASRDMAARKARRERLRLERLRLERLRRERLRLDSIRKEMQKDATTLKQERGKEGQQQAIEILSKYPISLKPSIIDDDL